MTTIDLELHCHSRYSPDSHNQLTDIIRTCQTNGIDRIAITDHNAIEGALLAHDMEPDMVIVGEEVLTTDGELLCFFIKELIPRGLTAEEAIDRVHDQGGIIGAAHPLDRPHRAGLGRDKILHLSDTLDFVEVFNARVRDPNKNEQARILAQQIHLPGTCGSDAHSLDEIGLCRVQMREYSSPQDFLTALRQANLLTQYRWARTRTAAHTTIV